MDITPIDFTSDVGRVRKYIPDVVQLADPANPSSVLSFMWSDDQIKSFIADEIADPTQPAKSYEIWRAAGYVMIATANNENLILKKITTEDLGTDGPAVADKLLKAAAALMKRADDAIAALEDGEAEVFLIHPYRYTEVWGL